MRLSPCRPRGSDPSPPFILMLLTAFLLAVAPAAALEGTADDAEEHSPEAAETPVASEGDSGEAEFRDEIEVTDQAEVSKSTTVLGREVIENEHAANLNDFLFSGVPGISTSRRTNFGFSGPGAGFAIRGLTNSQVAVFVDGLPNQINNHGHPRTDQYSADLIDRVEIIRGPSAVEHGPSAVGGVIQIFTRKPPTGFSGSVQLVAGELNTSELVGDLAYGWDGGHFLVGVTDRESDASEQLGEHFVERNVNLKLQQRISDQWNLGLSYRNNDEAPSDQFGSDPDRVFFRFLQDITTYTVSIDRTTENGRSRFAVYTNELDTGSFRESINDGQFLRNDRLETEDGVWVRHTWEQSENSTFSLGFEAVEYSDENPAGSTERSEGFVSPSFSFKRQLGSATALDGGLRVTDSSQFGTDVSPEIGVRRQVGENLALRARAGKAFRVPRVNQVFTPIPNPDLEPEEFLHAEVGANRQISERAVFDVALWWMDGDNLIQTIGQGPTTQSVNSGTFTHSGLEAMLNVRLNSHVGLFAGLALLDVSEGIRRIPQQTVDLGTDLSFGDFRGRAVLRHAGDNSTSSLDDYLVGDLRLSYEVAKGLRLSVDVINFTDETYATTTGFGGPILQPGRVFLGGVRYGWGR